MHSLSTFTSTLKAIFTTFKKIALTMHIKLHTRGEKEMDELIVVSKREKVKTLGANCIIKFISESEIHCNAFYKEMHQKSIWLLISSSRFLQCSKNRSTSYNCLNTTVDWIFLKSRRIVSSSFAPLPASSIFSLGSCICVCVVQYYSRKGIL